MSLFKRRSDEDKEIHCSTCGERVPPGAELCATCGAHAAEVAAPTREPGRDTPRPA